MEKVFIGIVTTSVSVGAHALATAPCLLHDIHDHHADIAEHRSRAARVAVSPRKSRWLCTLTVVTTTFFSITTSGEHSHDLRRVVCFLSAGFSTARGFQCNLLVCAETLQ